VLVDQVSGQVVDGDQPGQGGVVRVGDLAAALHRGDRRVLEVAHEPAKDVGPRPVVGVEDDDDLAGHAGQGGVECPGLAAAGSGGAVQAGQASLGGGDGVQELAGAVRRSVVHDDELQ